MNKRKKVGNIALSDLEIYDKVQTQSLKPVIPGTWKVLIRRNTVQGHFRQKIIKTPSQQKYLGKVSGTCYPRYTGSKNRIAVQVCWAKI
jgi:hypothetical protein